MDNKKLAYSVTEAAEVLGISKALLYKYIQEGHHEFPIKKIEGRILIPCKPLETYINGQDMEKLAG